MPTWIQPYLLKIPYHKSPIYFRFSRELAERPPTRSLGSKDSASLHCKGGLLGHAKVPTVADTLLFRYVADYYLGKS